MRILDRYVAKNFLVGYAISFAVLMGLRIVMDLFVNLDEFAEHAGYGFMAVAMNIITYYAVQATLYFRDFAGLITVIAAVFSLGKMTRNSELVAVMASGVSLKRLIAPIVLLALTLAALQIGNQELVIPRFADRLVLEHDEVGTNFRQQFWFLTDGRGSLVSCPDFDVAASTMYNPTVITRKRDDATGLWRVASRITADSATYDAGASLWRLQNGIELLAPPYEMEVDPVLAIDRYQTDLTPRDIIVRRKADFISLVGSGDLARLSAQKTKVRDVAQLLSEKHFRLTAPIIDLIMLMIALPVLVCRDPKTLKSAIGVSFILTGTCYLVAFVCRMLSTEQTFLGLQPELWAWMPIFIFLPIALLQLDSMKT